MARKVGLIEDWKKSWKLPSIQINLLGFLLMLIEFLSPTWAALPAEIQDKIPHSTTIALVLFGLGLIGRILKTQEKKDGDQ